jgi:electron transfer flavoprotein alpha subunit
MAGNVLALLIDTAVGGLTRGGCEAMGVARQAAAALGGSFAVALVDGSALATAEAAERGAERVYTPGTSGAPTADAVIAFAAEAVRRAEARVVVVARGGGVLEIVPRLAARLGGGCVMGVTELEVAGPDVEPVAAIYGGAARAAYRFRGDGPRVVSLAPTGGDGPPREAGRQAPVVEITAAAGAARVRVVEPPQAPEGPRLEDARVVVSGGRGLRDGENYGLIRELAAALGGMPGASRAIVDDSWATPAQQVGLTGKIVTPDLYVAAGISGASQHMAGCSNSRTIVAINTDGDAPIFRYAQFGIVGNCLDILPELIRLAKQRAVGG